MSQKQSRRHAEHEPADFEPIHRTPSEHKNDDFDDVLNDIDSVLEKNAKKFMDEYVQGNGE